MSLKIALRALALFLAAVSLSAIRLAAQDAPSVAEAARRTRQQKEEAGKPAKVIDNDSLPPSPVAEPGTSTSAESNSVASTPAASQAATGAATKSESSNANEAENKAQIEALKQQIAEKKEKVDFQQRELTLAQDSYYSNPDHERDSAGKQKLDAMRSDLEQAQSALADLQAKLVNLGLASSSDSKPVQTPKP